jgi:hypothetical protein
MEQLVLSKNPRKMRSFLLLTGILKSFTSRLTPPHTWRQNTDSRILAPNLKKPTRSGPLVTLGNRGGIAVTPKPDSLSGYSACYRLPVEPSTSTIAQLFARFLENPEYDPIDKPD